MAVSFNFSLRSLESLRCRVRSSKTALRTLLHHVTPLYVGFVSFYSVLTLFTSSVLLVKHH
ncbi:hypothetical protein CPB83DRAFT_864973 [Crepidotus variabilis]|uniref:Uncharacterized protein n=1 Tax=Crepidotus variabilis TaxID=179855 RepID=A0A9P6E455_9AGAR|nr:hypothetical protein CPB83DRAFT_864973 [Crepidotus variabilis]